MRKKSTVKTSKPNENKISKPNVEPLAYRVKDAARASGISRSVLYEYMNANLLRYEKIGRSRVIPADFLKAFLLNPPPPPKKAT